jgi:O-antigen/teichoic acid export membrane protein
MSITRRIFGATALVTLAQGFARLFGIISAPILTRILGPAPYGEMALINTVTTLAATISLFGIETSYGRNYYCGDKSQTLAVEQFCWRFAFGSSAVVGLLACLIIGTVSPASIGMTGAVLLIMWFLIVLGVTQQMALMRSRLHGFYRRLSLAIVISGIVSTVMTIALAIYWRQDVWPLIVGSLSGVMTLVMMTGMPRLSVLTRSSSLNTGTRSEVISLGIPVVFTAAMYWVMSSSDRWLIAAFSDQYSVGIYSFVNGIASLGFMLNNAIIMTWQPEAFRAYEENNTTSKYVLGRLWARLVAMMLIVWLTVAASGGDILRLLADPRFHSGASYIPWLAGGVFFYGVSTLANTGLLLSKDIKPAAYSWVLAGIVNVLINIAAIPRWGAIGAAVSNCFSYAFVAIAIMTISQRRVALDIPWRLLVTTSLVVFFMGGLMSVPWNSSPVFSMALKLPVGIIAATAIVRVMAPDWFARITAKLRKRAFQ